MKSARLIQEQVIITGASPEAITIHEHVLPGEKFQDAFDVQKRSECVCELLSRSRSQELAEMDETGAGVWIILGFDCINAFAFRGILSEIVQASRSMRATRHFPAGAFGRTERFAGKLFIEMLLI